MIQSSIVVSRSLLVTVLSESFFISHKVLMLIVQHYLLMFNFYNNVATFLPEVAPEQKWNQQETITSLVYKAGYRKQLTRDLQKSISCTRYQSSKCYLTYENYSTMKGAASVED